MVSFVNKIDLEEKPLENNKVKIKYLDA